MLLSFSYVWSVDKPPPALLPRKKNKTKQNTPTAAHVVIFMARRRRMCPSPPPPTSCDKRVSDAPSTHESLAKVAGQTLSFTTFLPSFFLSLPLCLPQTSQFRISHFMGLCRVTEQLFQNHRCIHSHTHTPFGCSPPIWATGEDRLRLLRKNKFLFGVLLKAAVRHQTGIERKKGCKQLVSSCVGIFRQEASAVPGKSSIESSPHLSARTKTLIPSKARVPPELDSRQRCWLLLFSPQGRGRQPVLTSCP